MCTGFLYVLLVLLKMVLGISDDFNAIYCVCIVKFSQIAIVQNMFQFPANQCTRMVEFIFKNATFEIANINNIRTGDQFNLTCDEFYHINATGVDYTIRFVTGELNCTDTGSWIARLGGCSGKDGATS